MEVEGTQTGTDVHRRCTDVHRWEKRVHRWVWMEERVYRWVLMGTEGVQVGANGNRGYIDGY